MLFKFLRVLFDFLFLLFEVYLSVFEALFRSVVPRRRRSLRGEVALVTGAGHGIGREFALQLGELGAKVVCWDLNESTNLKTREDVEAAGGVAFDFKCDVSDREQVMEAARKTREAVGEDVTFLVNNAGIMPAKPFLNLTKGDIDRIFGVNVLSQFWTLQAFLPRMVELDRGHVLCMSSTAGVTGTPFLTAYCASKHANKGMMEALLMEHRQEKPRCRVGMTTVHPFTVDTGLATNPVTRFPWFVPIVRPEDCARTALDAARRGEEEVFVPRRLRMLLRGSRVFPRRAQLAVQDFLGVGVGRDDLG